MQECNSKARCMIGEVWIILVKKLRLKLFVDDFFFGGSTYFFSSDISIQLFSWIMVFGVCRTRFWIDWYIW